MCMGMATPVLTSRDYVFITDWQLFGLPDPPEGMHWIFENGRYAFRPDSK